MAPEVYRGLNYDHRVDIYSLGIVLYRLMNNNLLPFVTQRQFIDPSMKKIALERRMCGEMLPLPCEASDGMADIILKACEYDPSKRYSTATEMKNDLLKLKNAAENGSPSVFPLKTDQTDDTEESEEEQDEENSKTSQSNAIPKSDPVSM